MSIWPQAIPKARPSSEADFVSPVIACFVAVYGAEFGRGEVFQISLERAHRRAYGRDDDDRIVEHG